MHRGQCLVREHQLLELLEVAEVFEVGEGGGATDLSGWQRNRGMMDLGSGPFGFRFCNQLGCVIIASVNQFGARFVSRSRELIDLNLGARFD